MEKHNRLFSSLCIQILVIAYNSICWSNCCFLIQMNALAVNSFWYFSCLYSFRNIILLFYIITCYCRKYIFLLNSINNKIIIHNFQNYYIYKAYTYLYGCVCACVRARVCVRICARVNAFVRMCVFMFVCVHLYVCICICMLVYV